MLVFFIINVVILKRWSENCYKFWRFDFIPPVHRPIHNNINFLKSYPPNNSAVVDSATKRMLLLGTEKGEEIIPKNNRSNWITGGKNSMPTLAKVCHMLVFLLNKLLVSKMQGPTNTFGILLFFNAVSYLIITGRDYSSIKITRLQLAYRRLQIKNFSVTTEYIDISL